MLDYVHLTGIVNEWKLDVVQVRPVARVQLNMDIHYIILWSLVENVELCAAIDTKGRKRRKK